MDQSTAVEIIVKYIRETLISFSSECINVFLNWKCYRFSDEKGSLLNWHLPGRAAVC